MNTFQNMNPEFSEFQLDEDPWQGTCTTFEPPYSFYPNSPLAGVEMGRDPSKESISSSNASSDSTMYSRGYTPETPRSYLMDPAFTISRSSEDDMYSSHLFCPDLSYTHHTSTSEFEDIRPTPSSLGFGLEKLLECYDFKAPKLAKGIKESNVEPYFQIKPKFANDDFPQIVYLDKSGPQKRGNFPCCFPECKQKPTRQADLERHYRAVHLNDSEKDSFPCDYAKCMRKGKYTFTRKDHSRDHLRDFHREDIGSPSKWKNERIIVSSWWRCSKCLVRVRVSQHGWECSHCKSACQPERMEARSSLKASTKEPHQGSISDMQQSLSHEFLESNSPSCLRCDDLKWVDDGSGSWEKCPCDSEYADQNPTWDGDESH